MNYNETAIKLFELLTIFNAADSDNAESWQHADDASYHAGAYGDVNRALVKLVGQAAVDHWCETGEVEPALFCRQPAKPTTTMSKNVYYDFSLDSIFAIDAPIGTDPETLIEQAKQKLVEIILTDDVTIVFENIYDCETGAYDEDWQGYTRE